MSRLIVVTAGGFGREVHAYATAAGFEVLGFLHDLDRYPGSIDGLGIDDQILGGIDDHEPDLDAVYAIGLGDVAPRKAVGEKLAARGARLATVIHPSAVVAPSAQLGDGVVLAPFTFVGPNVTVGDLTMFNTYASAGHDARIGRCCVVGPYAGVHGYAVLEDEVLLGSHAVVTPKRTVGTRSALAAGAVAERDVPPRSLAMGMPARSRELYRDG